MVGIALLAEARAAGLVVVMNDGRLIVRGPKHADALARRLLEHKTLIVAALAEGATGETATALAARREAPTVAVESEVVERGNAIAGIVGDFTQGPSYCDAVRSDAEANPFADWILRPDVLGRMGWEPRDLPERDRWWARMRI